MPTRLNPYISFDGNTREAMEHYQKALGGELTVHTAAEVGTPADQGGDSVMHARLETPSGFTLMASDVPAGGLTKGNTLAIILNGEDEAELRGYWENLSEGANITTPLDKQVWGDVFGTFTDRFGVDWMVNITAAQE